MADRFLPVDSKKFNVRRYVIRLRALLRHTHIKMSTRLAFMLIAIAVIWFGNSKTVDADTWRGKAPFCAGECNPGELQITTSKSGDGGYCFTGHKALCRNNQPLCTATQTNSKCYGVVKRCDNGYYEALTNNWRSCSTYVCGGCLGISSTGGGESNQSAIPSSSDYHPTPWTGVWIKSGNFDQADWGLSRSEFDARAREAVAAGYRPIVINVSFGPDGEMDWNSVWIRDGVANAWVYGWTRQDFDNKASEMHKQGYRPIMINAAVGPEGDRWNGIWIKDGAHSAWVYGWARHDFDNKAADMHKQGYRLLMINAVSGPDGVGWNGIWVRDRVTTEAVWGWARQDFDNKAAEMHKQGYRPLMITTVAGPGGHGWNAIWVVDSAITEAVWGWARQDFDNKAADMRNEGYQILYIE